MMQGITTLPGAQQGNQQAPGQAAQFQAMPPQQGGIAPPITAPLEKLPPQQLLTMYNNPQDTTPKWAVATAYAKAVEQARLMQMAQGQSAMAQGQAQAQQPPVVQQVMSQPIPQTQFARHGGVMHGYAGGGAVAFDEGGLTKGYAPDYQAMRAAGIDISPYDSPEVRADKFRRFEEYKRSGVVPAAAVISKELPAGAAEDREKLAKFASGIQKNALLPAGAAIADVATAIPRGLVGAYNSTVVRAMRAAGLPAAYLPDFAGGDFSSMTPFYDRLVRGPEQQEREEAKRKAEEAPPEASYSYEGRRKGSQEASSRATRTPAGIANLPGAAGSGGARPIGTSPSASSAESEFAAAMKKLEAGEQQAYDEASKLSPELIEARRQQELARQAGSKSRRDIEQRRLSDIQSQEEELKKGQGLGALDNPLLMMAIASGAGGKNFNEVLRGGVAKGYEEASRQQKDFRDRMDKLRAERLGVDQITIANMDYDAATQELKVAQLTGDRDKITAAKTKLLEAQRHLLDVRQRDVGSQRQAQIAREQMANAIKVAQIGAAARESATGLAEQRVAIQAMRADPSYAGIVKELAEAKKLAGVSNSPTFQARVRAAEAAATQLANRYGVTPGVMGMGGGAETPAAAPTTAPSGWGKATEVK